MKLGTCIIASDRLSADTEFIRETYAVRYPGCAFWWPTIQPEPTSPMDFSDYRRIAGIGLHLATIGLWVGVMPAWYAGLSLADKLGALKAWVTACLELQPWEYATSLNEVFLGKGQAPFSEDEMLTYVHTMRQVAPATKLVLNQHYWSPSIWGEFWKLKAAYETRYPGERFCDLVGWQAHIETSGWRRYAHLLSAQTLLENRARLQAEGIGFVVTEMDVCVGDAPPDQPTAEYDAQQNEWWGRCADLAWTMGAAFFGTWGVNDAPCYSWRSGWFPTFAGDDNHLKDGYGIVVKTINRTRFLTHLPFVVSSGEPGEPA